MNKKNQFLGLFFILIPLFTFGQGDFYILFSKTGDTLITRTSCFCKTKDTLSSYFNILANNSGSLKLLSVFEIREPNKNSIPCADFRLVPPDTLSKYGLTNLGTCLLMPDSFEIKSSIIMVDTFTTNKGEFVYHRRILHQFKIAGKTFYSSSVWDIAKNKNDKVEKPKISVVFGSTELNKYYFIVIIINVKIDRNTGKQYPVHTHTKIIY